MCSTLAAQNPQRLAEIQRNSHPAGESCIGTRDHSGWPGWIKQPSSASRCFIYNLNIFMVVFFSTQRPQMTLEIVPVSSLQWERNLCRKTKQPVYIVLKNCVGKKKSLSQTSHMTHVSRINISLRLPKL